MSIIRVTGAVDVGVDCSRPLPAGQLDQYRKVLSCRPGRSVDCNTCAAATFVLFVIFNVMMTRADKI